MTAVPSVTLEQLRDYAASLPPDEVIDLHDPCGCLAARLTGKEMWDHRTFRDRSEVPEPFAAFTKAVEDCRWPAGRVAVAMNELIAGKDPAQVAGVA